MQVSVVLAAGLALTALAWLSTSLGSAVVLAAPPAPPARPAASGHYALVVEGDRNQLAITAANAKVDPWAGVEKGLASPWQLAIRDRDGILLAEVPLDLSQFAVDVAVGRGVRVTGCIVRDPKIGMLVNVPRFPTAATYTFTRRDASATVLLGTTTSEQVQTFAGESR